MKRLFLAIPFSTEYQDACAAWQHLHQLQGIRMTPKEHLHITVAFFGDVAEDRIHMLSAAIQSVTERTVPFRLPFDRITAAPPRGRASMYWAQFANRPEFARFARDILAHTIPLAAHNVDRKPPLAHCTLARFAHLPRQKTKPPKIPEKPLLVSHVTLFETRQKQTGVQYAALESFPLAG